MSETRRWRIDLAYDGAAFHGWAAQRDLRTVQGELEHWITMVLRLDSPAELTVAGRTDAGVHARGQVAHLDLSPEHDATHLAHRLARVLPADVVVQRVVRAAPGFDARFSAIWRRYVYRLWDRDSAPDPLLRNHHTLVTERLDVAAMDQAAGLLVGLRDFAPFCRHRDRATTIRHLTGLRVARLGDGRGTIEFTVQADAFCHSMVRSLVGALWAVGCRRRDQAWLKAVIAHPTRHGDVHVMRPEGLCLEEVGYPPDAELAQRAAQARELRELPRPAEPR